MTVNGIASRVLKVCAARKGKKIIGNHRIIAPAVRAVAELARVVVIGFASEKKPPKLAGPSLAVNAYSADASSNSAQNVQTRLKSSSENSHRVRTIRALSRMAAITAPTTRNPDCQPQKSSAAPRRSGGGFMFPR